MLKACPTCGGIHEYGADCPKRINTQKERRSQYDRSKNQSERSSKADKFRNTKSWQRKRREIQERDLHLCRYCFLIKHKITTNGLSVHHIIPLNENFSLRLSSRNLITLCRECHEQAEKGALTADELRSMTSVRMKL